MPEQPHVARHCVELLECVRARCELRDADGNSAPWLGAADVAAIISTLKQLGMDAAADSLSDRFERLKNAMLDTGLTAMVADGEDAERLQRQFGQFPLPAGDPGLRKRQVENSELLVGGIASDLSVYLRTVINTLRAQADRRAEHQVKNAAACARERLSALADDAMMNHVDIARALGLAAEALRRRLDRWRAKNGDGWQEITEPKRHEPKYVYRIGAVRHVLHNMLQ